MARPLSFMLIVSILMMWCSFNGSTLLAGAPPVVEPAGAGSREGVMPTALSAKGIEQAPIARFFRMGDGQIHIKSVKTGLAAKVQLLREDGLPDESALTVLDRVFGVSEEEKGQHVSLRLLFLLDYFSDKIAPGKMLYLESGYRSPEYNQKLRRLGGNVAATSTHMDAMAIDFYISGVEGKQLWEMIRKEECCGIGHYGDKTVHLDCARPRFWEAATSKVKSGESEFNRRIFLSTEYDRYSVGETIRLSLVSVSDFGFGISSRAEIIDGDGRSQEIGLIEYGAAEGLCVPINKRKDARSMAALLPERLSPGRYHIRLRFCKTLFPQMPKEVISNAIEIAPGRLSVP